MANYKVIGADLMEYGPVSADQIRQWITEGRVNAETKLQAGGTAEWRPLAEVPEFAAALPDTSKDSGTTTAVHFRCPHCNVSLAGNSRNAGSLIKCPKCRRRLTIPPSSTVEPPPASPPEESPEPAESWCRRPLALVIVSPLLCLWALLIAVPVFGSGAFFGDQSIVPWLRAASLIEVGVVLLCALGVFFGKNWARLLLLVWLTVVFLASCLLLMQPAVFLSARLIVAVLLRLLVYLAFIAPLTRPAVVRYCRRSPAAVAPPEQPPR